MATALAIVVETDMDLDTALAVWEVDPQGATTEMGWELRPE
jgi:hypothetical protein